MGSFLEVMQKRGWQVSGVEISADAVAQAHERGIELFCGVFEEFQTDQTFDSICMYQTLEHVMAPAYALRRSFELLNPDGTMIIEVPNLASYDAKHNQERRLLNYDLPRHLHHFYPHVLANKLREIGFTVVEIDYYYPNALLDLAAKRLSASRGANASSNNSTPNSTVQGTASPGAASDRDSATLPMAQRPGGWKQNLLRGVARFLPGWRFTIIARKPAA
jgi:SAM-dependent methyltransferase